MKAWMWFVLIVVALAALVGWRLKSNSGEEGQVAGRARGARTAVVQVALAGPATIKDTIEAVGSLESPNVVQLSPRTSGRIEFLQVREGDSVRAGQMLAQIDPAEADAQVVQAQANLAQAQSRLAEAKLQQGPNSASVAGQVEQQTALVASADADLEQVKRNSESQIESAQASVGDAEAKVRSSQAQVTNALAVLERERASLKNAQTKLDRTLELYRQGFIAAQDVDDAKTSVDVQDGNVKVAAAQLDAAKQAKTSADKQLDVSKLNLAMAQRKATSDVSASQARAVQARSALKIAKANEAQNPAYKENIAALQSAVDAARAQLDLARSTKSNTVLSSPIDGVVSARNSDPGSLASPGQPVLVVQSLDWLFFAASLPIEASSAVKDGQSVEVTVDGLEGRTFTGKVTHVNLVADPQSRQFGVQVRLENPDRALRPGMFGRIRIVTREISASVAVPKEALTENDKGTTVAVVGDDMKVQVREVKKGATDGKQVEIANGVSAGEKVVVLTLQPLRDGQTVSLPQPAGGRTSGRR